jgi:hypothetical protein
VFGYVKLAKLSYIILIKEASIVGQIIGATILRVEELSFIPISQSQTEIDPEDESFVGML